MTRDEILADIRASFQSLADNAAGRISDLGGRPEPVAPFPLKRKSLDEITHYAPPPEGLGYDRHHGCDLSAADLAALALDLSITGCAAVTVIASSAFRASESWFWESHRQPKREQWTPISWPDPVIPPFKR